MAFTKSEKIEAYHLMRLIRRFEERCAQLYAEGEIGGFLHLYIGQEAIAAALKYALNDDDNLITAYRDHGIALARGLDAKAIMAEMMGKETGVSGGFGGSMHLADASKRFWGGWAIVGSQIPLGGGLAMADKYLGSDRLTVCLMGDGATNIGYFHESLNMAAVWDLPVIWVIENNEYGMGTAVSRASAVTDLTKKALAYDIPAESVNGNDLHALMKTFTKAAKHARTKGPFLIEAETYRFRGHSMGDPERYRDPTEIETRRSGDPLVAWYAYLLEEKLVTNEDLDAIDAQVEKEVEEAVEFARSSPEPKDLFANVYV